MAQKEEPVLRVPLPNRAEGEMFAVVEQRVGYGHMFVRCEDGRIRLGRVPGRLSRKLWVREGDLVIIKPWEVQGHKKCDILYRYTPTEREWLIENKKIPEDLL